MGFQERCHPDRGVVGLQGPRVSPEPRCPTGSPSSLPQHPLHAEPL